MNSGVKRFRMAGRARGMPQSKLRGGVIKANPLLPIRINVLGRQVPEKTNASPRARNTKQYQRLINAECQEKIRCLLSLNSYKPGVQAQPDEIILPQDPGQTNRSHCCWRRTLYTCNECSSSHCLSYHSMAPWMVSPWSSTTTMGVRDCICFR